MPTIRKSIQITGANLRQLAKAPAVIQKAFADILKLRANELVDRIQAIWPKPSGPSGLYSTGWSASRWKAKVILSGSTPVVRLTNPTNYAIYVHRPGQRGGRKRGWETIYNTEIRNSGGIIDQWTDDVREQAVRFTRAALLASLKDTGRVPGARIQLR